MMNIKRNLLKIQRQESVKFFYFNEMKINRWNSSATTKRRISQKQLITLTEAAKKRLEKLGEGGKLRVNDLI